MFKRTINGYKKAQRKLRAKRILKGSFSGKYIEDPEQLPNGCHVVLLEKESDWWEYGKISTIKNGRKVVTCINGCYEFEQVEVYLDTRYQ